MQQPTEPHHAGEATGRSARIEEALSACHDLPPVEQLARLDARLRTDIQELVGIVREQLRQLPPRSVDWYARRRTLLDSQEALAEPLRDTPLAAAIGVAELGRRLRELDGYARGER
ncbi:MULTISPECIES: DUF6415 family natural product biosynthesis protein [Streptomyces]|uniref:DUF6415 family natural product biosynthesis protein n=1 Tax=Streptomyces TaxID=1883 RepID=UPI0006EB5ACE|nr:MULTISPECIES: DUF6415 family natural product biosynthesis protein [Streptomyces]